MVRSATASKADPRLKVAFVLMAGVLGVLTAQPFAAAVAKALDVAVIVAPSRLG
jgi:urocanate hydratase